MNYKEYDHNKIDPELDEILLELRHVPPRDPEKAEKTKSKFLAAIDNVKNTESKMTRDNQTNFVRQIKEYFKMATPRMKKVYQTAAIAIFIIALLFGGAGITAAVAANSLPGDGIYPIKARMEQTRIQLTSSSEERVLLNLQYAQERLNEIESLIAEGRFNDIGGAVRDYEQYIQRALSELAGISANDPDRAQLLFNQIAGSLQSFALAFENVSGNDSRVPSFDDVIRFSQSAGAYSGKLEFTGVVSEISEEEWVVSGYLLIVTAATEIEGNIAINDIVKVEAWIDTEGMIYVIEVEKTSEDDDDFDNEFEIAGIVSELGEGYLIVNGLRFEFGPETELDDDFDEIQVGDKVEIEARMMGDGGFLIEEINFEDDLFDDDDDMYDDDDDDMYDDDDDDMYDDDDDMYDDDDDDMYGDDDDDMNDDDDDDMYDDGDDDDMYDDGDDDDDDDDDMYDDDDTNMDDDDDDGDDNDDEDDHDDDDDDDDDDD